MSSPRALAALPLLAGLLLTGCAGTADAETSSAGSDAPSTSDAVASSSAPVAAPSSTSPAPVAGSSAGSPSAAAPAAGELPPPGTRTWVVVAALGPEDGTADAALSRTSEELSGQGHTAAVEPLRCVQGAAQALDAGAQQQAVVVFVASEDAALQFVAAHPGPGVGYAQVTVACAG